MIRELKLSLATDIIQIETDRATDNIKAVITRKGDDSITAEMLYIDTENGISTFKPTPQTDRLPYGYYELKITSGKNNSCICGIFSIKIEKCSTGGAWICDGSTQRIIEKECVDPCKKEKQPCPKAINICDDEKENEIKRDRKGLLLDWKTTKIGNYEKCEGEENDG